MIPDRPLPVHHLSTAEEPYVSGTRAYRFRTSLLTLVPPGPLATTK